MMVSELATRRGRVAEAAPALYTKGCPAGRVCCPGIWLASVLLPLAARHSGLGSISGSLSLSRAPCMNPRGLFAQS